MGSPQFSQSPYVPSSNFARACSTSASVSLQRVGQGLRLAALGGHLARIGEVLVVREAAVVAEAQVSELMAQLRTLLVEGGAEVGQPCVARHGRDSTWGGVAWRAGEPRRRPAGAARS